MKYLFVIAIAFFAVSCGATKSSPPANSSAGLTKRQPKAESPRFTVSQLLTLVAMDIDDKFDDKHKGSEMVVLGQVEKAEGAIFHFYGGDRKQLGCMRGEGESYEKLVSFFKANPAKKPMVEAIVKYNAGNHDPKTGETYVSLEDCAILSVSE